MVGIGEQGQGSWCGAEEERKKVKAKMKSVVLVPKNKAVTMIWFLKL